MSELMHYVICGNYRPLLFALYLKNNLDEITVITDKEKIVKFCKNENISIIQMNSLSFKRDIINMLRFKSYRSYLDDFIDKINPKKGDIFYMLCIMRKANHFFYLTKEISKKYGNKIYYYNPNIEGPRYKFHLKKPIFFRAELFRIFLKIIFDIDMIYITDNRGLPCLRLNNKFLDKNNIKMFPLEKSFEEIVFELSKNYKTNYKDFDNLIVDSTELKSVLKKDTLKNFYNNLLDLKLEFYIKKKPSVSYKSDYYSVFEKCEEVPSFIPVELLFNNVRKNVISMYSFSLHIAAKFDNLNAISLIDLVEWKNDKAKEMRRDYLVKKSDNKILFPKNFDELKKLLAGN